MNIQDYILSGLLILIPSCWGIGLMLKSVPRFNNQWIPPILCAFSVAMSCLWVFASVAEPVAMNIFTGITQGVLCWLVAWLTYEKGIKKIGGE